MFKALPVALAVSAAMASMSALAETNVELLEKRIQELENRLGSTQIEELQDDVAEEELKEASDFEVVFTGYARYGAAFRDGQEKFVTTAGALNGNATGRLGNEGNGGEFQIATKRTSASGAQWDLVLMLDEWSNMEDVVVRKMYAGVSNIFASQPNLYLWAGRNFNQRPMSDLSDYYWMTHDGQGAGMQNFELGGTKFDLAVVEDVEDGSRFAVTAKLHGIELGGTNLSLYANYGFSDKDRTVGHTAYNNFLNYNRSSTAYQLAAELSFSGQRLVARYSENAVNSAFDLASGHNALLFSFEGGLPVTESLGLQYLAAYQTLDVDVDNTEAKLSRDNYNAIVRPTYAWNDIHSTWLEMGYNVVDYKDLNASNKSWKVTLSQNIAINAFSTGARPMIRFYATAGKADNEFTGFDSVANEFISANPDTVTFGAMFEAWW